MSLQADEAARLAYFRKVEKLYERKIAAIYRDALATIRADMAKIYDKHAVNGVLTKAEMTRYNRLASMEDQIVGTIKPAVNQSIKTIDRLKPEEYGQAFFRTAWAIDNAAGVGLNWGLLNKDTIVANLNNPSYARAVTYIRQDAEGIARIAVNQGLALGKSYPTMMKDLKEVITRENYQTMRILRTELHSAQEAGTAAGYLKAQEQGVRGDMVWDATLDGDTREEHAAMDGVMRDEDGWFRGALIARYPGDPELDAGQRINCRCSMRFELEGFSPTIRRSREDGIIPYQTYRDWSEDRKVFGNTGNSGKKKTVVTREMIAQRTGIDISGSKLDIEDLEFVTDRIVELNKEFKTEVKSIAEELNPNAYASSSGNRLFINSEFVNNKKEFQLHLDQEVASGWHPAGTNTLKGIIDHEMGHNITNTSIGIYDMSKSFPKILESGRPHIEFTEKAIDIRKRYTSSTDKKNFISTYANTSLDEFIGESMSMVMNNPNPSTYAKELYDLVVEYRGRKP
jgi:hypothetical protein